MYYQIRTHLLEMIESGQLKTGDRVPSERELTEQFGVSRMTARQALKELEALGYLSRQQGKGTFVTTPKLVQPLAGLTSFTEEMRQRGLVPGAVVLAVEEVLAGWRVAEALGISQTAPVLRLQRLRLADGLPLALEISHIPSALCPGLGQADFENQSLYKMLADRYGIRLIRAAQSLEAVAASPYEAAMLQVKEGTPLLLIERVSQNSKERPVEFVRSLYRGDRYRFTAELIRR